MIPEWPSELPRPLRNSWQRTLQEPRQKRSTDAGPPGYRRRFSSVAKLVTMAIQVDLNAREVFWQFHDNDTAYGSIPFYMPDPTKDGWPVLDSSGNPVLTDEGQPILLAEKWLCTFGEQLPAESIVGIEYRISFSVAVMP